jgi:GNAT superfamily N-acetyltransferase
MRTDTLLLRAPEERDLESIVALLDELGHPAGPVEVARRLGALRELDPTGFLVVADASGRAVGLVSAHLTPMLHREQPVGRVTTLVVAAAERGKGVGGLLLAAAEGWCREHGAVRIELTSADRREDSHGFYERRGWRKEGLRFVRED